MRRNKLFLHHQQRRYIMKTLAFIGLVSSTALFFSCIAQAMAAPSLLHVFDLAFMTFLPICAIGFLVALCKDF